MRLIDGTTVSLADTEENQNAYPQLDSQKPGSGFPICRLVAVTCLATGAVLKGATGPCKGKDGEDQRLLCSILDTLQRVDILV